MNTKQITAKEVKPYMILVVDGKDIVVTEAWEDQGPGLGIMIKGQTVEDVKDWERRYINPDMPVTQIVGRNG